MAHVQARVGSRPRMALWSLVSRQIDDMGVSPVIYDIGKVIQPGSRVKRAAPLMALRVDARALSHSVLRRGRFSGPADAGIIRFCA